MRSWIARLDVAAEGVARGSPYAQRSRQRRRRRTPPSSGPRSVVSASTAGVNFSTRFSSLECAPLVIPRSPPIGVGSEEHAKDEPRDGESSTLMILRAWARSVPCQPCLSPRSCPSTPSTPSPPCSSGVALWRLGLSPQLPAVLAFIFGGVLLAVIDWKVRRLPTRLVDYTLAGVAAGLTFVVARQVGLEAARHCVAWCGPLLWRVWPDLVRVEEDARPDGARLRRRSFGDGARRAARLVRPRVRVLRRAPRTALGGDRGDWLVHQGAQVLACSSPSALRC